MSEEYSLEYAMKLAIGNALAGAYTAIPCTIVAVYDDLKSLKVDVQPSINQQYADGTSDEHPPIMGVPVQMPSGRISMVSFPLFKGDTGLCVFSQSNIDNFKLGDGSFQDAASQRRNDMNDAIFIPGVVPFSRSLNNPAVRRYNHSTSDLVVAHNIGTGTEVELRLTASGKLKINTDVAVEVNAPEATLNIDSAVWNGDITHNGNFTNTGSITSNGVSVSTHRHNGGALPD